MQNSVYVRKSAGAVAACLVCILAVFAQTRKKTDVQHDGFNGGVRTVLTENAKLSLKQGQLVESSRRFSSKWSYDIEGRLIEERTLGSYRTYRYDQNGNRYEARSIHPGKSPVNLDDFHYQQEKSTDGSSLYRWIAKYDASGNRIEETVFTGVREPHSQLLYRYDNQGRRIEVIRQALGAPIDRVVYVYDAAGRLEEKMQYDDGRTTPSERTHSFEFDSTGNWVKSTISKPRKRSGKVSLEPVEVTYRTITYY
jgi:hypothetical protein